jgi:hypothetical protein
MAYQISRESEYPIVVLHMTGVVSIDETNDMLNDCARHIQAVEGIASLVLDFGRASMESVERFTQAVIIFHRSSGSFKSDAPIYYALVGETSTLDEVIFALGELRFHAPTFKSVTEAISYLNLRVGSTYLRESQVGSETARLDTLLVPRLTDPQQNPAVATPGTAQFPSGGVLRMEDVDSRQTMLFFPKDELYIGRQESGHEKPDMDLSMWGAFHRGVSREHALLIRTTSQLLLSDLDSTNGTFVNGERLNPDEPQVLHSGDEVTFGSLTVRVFFQHTIEGEVEAY